MSEPTKRTFDEIYVDIRALDLLYAMLAIGDKDYEVQHKALLNELKGLSNDDKG